MAGVTGSRASDVIRFPSLSSPCAAGLHQAATRPHRSHGKRSGLPPAGSAPAAVPLPAQLRRGDLQLHQFAAGGHPCSSAA